jgi:formylglycine-generating enzyme required for sulfatase activity
MNPRIQFVVVVLFSILISDFFQNSPLQAAEKKSKERLAVLDLEAKHGVDKRLAEALLVVVRDKLHRFGDIEALIGAMQDLAAKMVGRKVAPAVIVASTIPAPTQALPGTVSPHPVAQVAKTFTERTTGMEFVLLPGDCYQMGDTFGDGQSNEKPVHEACIDSFYLGKYEVTQGEYAKIAGDNPSRFKKGDRYPLESVSWNDTQIFIRSLNTKSSLNFRLPTEAEWEYAARSGGKKEKYAGGDDIDAVAWYNKNSGSSTHPVGGKRPNGLGLYDMSGNVWEWCNDWYDSGYYGISVKNNTEGPSSGSFRIHRGGSWFSSPRVARAAYRLSNSPGNANDALGFRLALPVQRP